MITLLGRRREPAGDSGAQTLEFSLAAPAALFVMFGVVYALLVLAANVTLAHAASAAVRYASTPTDAIEPVYPGPAEVAAKLFSSTPFFSPSACTTSVAGAPSPNAVVALSVSCPFPNPLGTVLNGLRGVLPDGSEAPFGETFEISASATGRRE